ncbi:hypothetical protein [Mucilaginibacter sp. FT3.2]|uniref:hypothetical protein n=1 Tax=Mucilaginibacter sp. FT3.2 TaxID=2723090 RepID=UPI0016079E47|nr:hypothetical protein [Mucilaginibacter sp. FT3.2]MBB6234886.1 hypothetical protein [Mucilaginibacter sp. FT3.2]
MSIFFAQFFCGKNDSYSLIIEDDEFVAYAYLYFEGKIIGDLWLYNQAETPIETNWDQHKAPYLNPAVFLKDGVSIEPIKYEDEINCQWNLCSDDGLLREVGVKLRGTLIGILQPGAMPGWSAFVKLDGPLAKVLE